MTGTLKRWPRVIAHADMDAFYAAVEQLDDPGLRGRPVLVGPASRRGVVLTASYEARPFKVGSAMPMARARQLCPQAIVVPPRFERYQQVSMQLMKVFDEFSPCIEALSLDEAFLDMTGSEQIFGNPESMAKRLQHAVREVTGGLTVSVGVSGTKYVAKVASGHRKPDGVTIVPPETARAWLAPQSVARLWGAGAKTERKLRALGFDTIGDVAAADPGRLEQLLGQMGRHFYALARADDPRPVLSSRAPKSLGSERTLNVDVGERREIEFHLRKSAEAVARRLRRQSYLAQGVRIKLKRPDFHLLTRQHGLAEPTDLASELFRVAASLLRDVREPGPFRLIGLAAYDLIRGADWAQPSLPIEQTARARRLETALDRVSERFGAGAVQRAADLLRDGGIGVSVNLDFLDQGEEDSESRD